MEKHNNRGFSARKKYIKQSTCDMISFVVLVSFFYYSCVERKKIIFFQTIILTYFFRDPVFGNGLPKEMNFNFSVVCYKMYSFISNFGKN